MEAFLIEWLNLLGRWVHMITGVAWIGASFYFVWLDNHLQPPKSSADADKGVGGELWAVHGGGFYHAQKYRVAPAQLPKTLHWFKWEAYTTWLTGMYMLVLIYWYGAEIYLIDASVMELSTTTAIAIGAASIVLGWLIYDLMCKSALAKSDTTLGAGVFVLVIVAAWGLCQVFGGRGAFMHFGAIFGTIMVANVFFVIMPGQRAMVAATEKGETVDPKYGITAKQRSVHNTYFTLPVLFVMISNHYASTYSHEYNWLILIGISLAGALIRVYFVQRHFGKQKILLLIIAAVILAATAALTVTPKNSDSADSALSPEQRFARVEQIIESRCASCHADKPTQAGFASAPKGVVLTSADHIRQQAQTIYQQTVLSKAMPIGNLTKMTDAERAILNAWYQEQQ